MLAGLAILPQQVFLVKDMHRLCYKLSEVSCSLIAPIHKVRAQVSFNRAIGLCFHKLPIFLVLDMGFPKKKLRLQAEVGSEYHTHVPDRILYLEHGIGNLDYASIDSTD